VEHETAVSGNQKSENSNTIDGRPRETVVPWENQKDPGKVAAVKDWAYCPTRPKIRARYRLVPMVYKGSS